MDTLIDSLIESDRYAGIYCLASFVELNLLESSNDLTRFQSIMRELLDSNDQKDNKVGVYMMKLFLRKNY